MTRRRGVALIAAFVGLASMTGVAWPQMPQAALPSSVAVPPPVEPVIARNGMVVTQEARASQIGREVLEKGGNAVDAAVAVGFALAVTLPKAGNLGGGGFMIVHLADHNQDIAIDYRETAPAATTRDIFLDSRGNADPEKSRNSGLAVGVPGTVAGLTLALEKYGSGRFGLAELIEPALALARNGVPIEDDLFDSLLLAQPRLARWPSSKRIFLKPSGAAPAAGSVLLQPDLAATLALVARGGASAFYAGPVADKIVAAVGDAGGRMTLDDLKAYRAIVREPIRGTYRGYDIVSMPPPSSGGVHLVEMLNILEGEPLPQLGRGTASLHLMIEAMKLAYADRAESLGDSDAVAVPVEKLIAKDYAGTLRAGISLERARPSAEIKPGSAARGEGANTTHFSIVDHDGNAVANTYTLNFNYGLGLVAEGTGVVLNNELDDFAAKPGSPNAFGLVGADANAPGPSKRPLSSMTPTIVLKDGKVVYVTGSPGGSRIITTVLQVIVNAIDFKQPIADAVWASRVHHQWLPDEVEVEATLPADIMRALTALGHHLRVGPPSGSAHSIAITADGLVGAADTRVRGAKADGY